MKQKDLVSVIIVNWNGMQWLSDCFNSLAKQDWENYEIIFVDNASRDNSVAWVRKHFPRTICVTNKQNLGFADANNIGFRKAKGKYVLFLNNDTRVERNFLSILVNTIESDPAIGGVQSKLRLMDQPDRLDAIGAFFTNTGFLYHYGFHAKDSVRLDTEIDLYTAKGACMMFRKSVLDHIAIAGNIFDPTYFAYFEETDMCHRVWLSGYRITYVPKSVVYHKAGGTSAAMNNTFIQYHSFKNRIQSYVTNLSVKTLLVLMPIHLLFTSGFAFVAFLRGKWRLSFAIISAVFWNIRHLGETKAKRSYVQNHIRKLSDSKLLPKITRNQGIRYYRKLLGGISLYQHE
jgi:GT2 family glycosyltransferase